MSKDKTTIGEHMREYRFERNISQDCLSKPANVAFHTIVKIESVNTPNPAIETVRKIAAALRVSIDNLMQ